MTSPLDGRSLCLCRGHLEERVGWRLLPAEVLTKWMATVCGPHGDLSTDATPPFVGEVSLSSEHTWWPPLFARPFLGHERTVCGESLLCRVAPLGGHEEIYS